MSETRKLLFSQFSSQEFQQISQLLSSVFQTSPEELSALYQQIGDDFNQEGWPPHFVPRKFFQSAGDKFRETYEKSPSIGIDLPSCLERNDGNQNKPTVVILGQDPKGHEDHERISLGTPYGMHHKGSREQLTATKLYFEMIQVLLDLGYRVYLTDIYKIWVCNPQRRYSGVALPKMDQKRFLKILESELAAIEPTAVITWGKLSEIAVSNLDIGLHLGFPHPSGAANHAWKILLMGESPTNANKLVYWETKVREVLSSQ